MFEKIGQSAEKVVGKVSLSRRGFLGRAARLAARLGAVAAGLAAFPAEAQAGSTRRRRLGPAPLFRCPSGQAAALFGCNNEGNCVPPSGRQCPQHYPHKEIVCI